MLNTNVPLITPTLDCDRHSDKDGTHQVASNTFIFRCIFFLSSSNIQWVVGQHINSVVPGDRVPLTGPRNGWMRLSSCLTVQYDFAASINNSFYWLKSDNGRTYGKKHSVVLSFRGVISTFLSILFGNVIWKEKANLFIKYCSLSTTREVITNDTIFRALICLSWALESCFLNSNSTSTP